MISYIRKHLPAFLGIAVVIVSTMEQQGTIHLSDNLVILINAVLGSLGLGVLHYRILNK